MARTPKARPTLADMLRYTPAEWDAEQTRLANQPPEAAPAPRSRRQQLDDEADARAFERAMRGRD